MNGRAVEGEKVLVVINHVKADHWEKHKDFVFNILIPAAEKLVPAEMQQSRFLYGAEPEEDGTYTSVWLMDPVIEDGKPAPKTFWGVSLALTGFCILNIEIASFFASKGDHFSFLTHGSLSKQLAYSIGWMLFSIGLLTVGVKWKDPKIRWAAIALLGVTSLKIFIRDLWSLGQLYRVGSFVGLAVVMILVSVIYQKFLSEDDGDEQKNEQQPPAARG